MIWVIFIKILKHTIQIKRRKILIVFDDMIADIFSNKKLVTKSSNIWGYLGQFGSKFPNF